MAVSASEQKAVVNVVERWLSLNADADRATLKICIDGTGVFVTVKERRRLAVQPVSEAG